MHKSMLRILKKCFISMLVISTACLLTVAVAAEVQWIAPGGGNWHDPANWSGSTLPVAADDVLINIPDDSTIDYTEGDTRLNSITMTGNLNLLAGNITVTAVSQITGSLTVQQQATLTADGGGASIIVNGTANIDGGNVFALNGGQISLPGATRYQGGGTLRAQGIGSKLDLSSLTDIGIGTPGSTDISEAFSRAVSVYHKPLGASEEGPAMGINEAYSRAVSVYHKPVALPEDGPALGINESYSRAVSVYHKSVGLPEDGPGLGINESYSRAVSVYHKPVGLPEDGPALGINEAFSRQVMIENVVPPEE